MKKPFHEAAQDVMDRELVPQWLCEAVAHRFRVLGEAHRLMILNALYVQGEQSVRELAGATGLRQPNLSKHLHALAEEGLVRRRREGTRVFYRLDAPELPGLCLLACAPFEEAPEQPA
ncbi:ArsR/SmtB family transcription factor [Rhodocaloribacter sp.]